MNEKQHPWIVFPETKKGNKLILGSFPPKRFTINPQNLPENDINFFYGSSDNKFWEMFCISKGLNYNWRLSPEKLKNYLIDNNWIVSDIILKTTRKVENALDKDLIVTEWNIKIIKEILDNNNIETIYFTSKWVQEKFCTKIFPSLTKIPKTVILISPSRNGLMSLNWAREIYPQLKTETNTEYRQRYYTHFLNL